jgi:hypothetical protein
MVVNDHSQLAEFLPLGTVWCPIKGLMSLDGDPKTAFP